MKGIALSFLLSLIAAGEFAVPRILADTPATTSSPATAGEIKTLIDQLGDKDFKVRAAAEKELVRIGRPALDALVEAAKSNDSEIKQRASRAASEINSALAVTASMELARNYLWTYPIKNGAIGAPAVCGGSAYAVGKDMKLHCVDIKTGKMAWAIDLKDRAFGSEIFAGHKVVFLTQGMVLTAFAAADGKQLWQKDMNAAPPGGRPATEFMAGRLAAWNMGDLVVAQAGLDKFKGYKALTGEDAWEIEVKRPAENFPCAPAMEGGILFAKTGQSIAAIDLTTQKELWRQDKDVANCTAVGAGGGTLCSLVADKIIALDAKKGAKLWAADAPGRGDGPGRGAPGALRVGRLVADDANLYLALTGAQALAAYDLKKGDMRILNLDVGVPMNEAQKTAAGLIGGDDKPVAWGCTWWAVSGGSVYTANDIAMFAFDIKTTKRLWMLLLSDPLSGEMAVVDGVIYFATDYRPKPPPPGEKEKPLPDDLPGLHALKIPK